MQLSHSRKLVGADCVAPCRMAFPPQELLWLFRLESIDIWLFLRDYRKGLPYEFVGDCNNRHFSRLDVRTQSVKTFLAFGIASQRCHGSYIKLTT